MHDELAHPGNQATHNQLNAATPQLQTAVAGVKDKTSNDLLPAQTSADQGSLKPDGPNAPALLPGPPRSQRVRRRGGAVGPRWWTAGAGRSGRRDHHARPALARQDQRLPPRDRRAQRNQCFDVKVINQFD